MDRSTFEQRWLGHQELKSQTHGTMGRLDEQANTTALVLTLTPTPVSSVLSGIADMADDAIKSHPGVHLTFVILKILSPGWSSVPIEGDAGNKRKAGAKGAFPARVYGEKYASMLLGEHAKIHSYELVNKKGAKGKGDKSEDFVCFSPGMVISGKIFGDKIATVFGKNNGGDLLPFQLATVQFTTKSLGSTAVDTGHMLDIKGITALPHISLRSLRILPPPPFFATTVQGNIVKRDNFLAGLMLPEEYRTGLNQNMIKAALPTMYSVVDAGYLHPKQGTPCPIQPEFCHFLLCFVCRISYVLCSIFVCSMSYVIF